MAQNVVFKDFKAFQEEGKKLNTPFACTSLIVKDLNNNVYHGRGMELTFGESMTHFTYYPKGSTFQHLAPDKSQGLKYESKYNIMALTTPISIFDVNDALEGINDAGLAFSLNMMPSPPLNDLKTEDYKISVPFASFGEWALANFATVSELKQNITTSVAFWSEELEMLGGLQSPFHFAIYDKTGGSVVVEVKNGNLVVYDNPTGVMTNGPEFPWHIENLNNYSHLSNIDISASKIGNLNLRQPDSGIAASTIPASLTSVGRFVKAFYYSSYANKVSDPDLQLAELGHVMNNFDRPKNITKSLSGEGESGKASTYMTEFTLWIVLADLTRGQLYVRLYDQLNYQKFTFEQYKDQNTIVNFVIK